MASDEKRRIGRRVTIEEAREIALRSMELVDALMKEDREREISFLRSLENLINADEDCLQ